MDKEVFFEAREICAGYEKRIVLENLHFTLKTHTLTALLGANGSGKSTLVKSIANQLKHQGRCLLQEEVLEELSIRKLARKVSYMPQRSGISVSLPVLDVVLMGFNPVLKLLEQPSCKQRQMAKEALEKVGIAHLEDRDYLTLSEGQKQLVFLARTMIEDTSLLLLDEPDSALDFANRHLVLKTLREMVQQKEMAGLLCLHDPGLALEYCQQLILLKDGCCVGAIVPEKDSVKDMEDAFREIYGEVSLMKYEDRKGKSHFTLIWEE